MAPPEGESYKDLLSFAESFFAGDFATQPRFVVDLDVDDLRLVRLFEVVKELPRGKALAEWPLTMVGIGRDEESLVAPKIAMCVKRIPHKVMTGDLAKPSTVLAALKQRKVDVTKCLFLQVRERPTEPGEQLPETMEIFARQAMPGEASLFASYVRAMHVSAALVEKAMALVLVDRDPPPPVALAMAAATAGLFPPDVKKAMPSTTEEEGVRVFTQLLQVKEHKAKARFAVAADLPALQALEEMAWKEALRAPKEGLLKRLSTSPTTNFAFEVEGQVVAVLYTQRINVPQDVFSQRFQQVFEGHKKDGRTLQLIAINAHNKHKGLGTELRSFALHLARLDQALDRVCAVTLCMDYAASGLKNLQQYVDMHQNGRVNDRILTFHTSYGAAVLGLVPKYRPEDVDNEGTGVLIQYKPKEWLYDPGRERVKVMEVSRKKKPKEPQIPALDILSGIMTDMGYAIDMDNLDQGFFASGLDSFDMGVIQNRLGRALGRTLPATLMLDLPTVKELSEQLDKDRGIGQVEGSGSDSASEATSSGSESGERRGPRQREKSSERRRATTERASDDSITEWVRSWRQYLYEKTKAKRASERVRSGTPRRRSSSRRSTAFDKLGPEEFEKIQQKLTKLLQLPRNQRRLVDVVEKNHESELGLFCDLRPVLDSIMGPPLLAMGLVQDSKPRSLQDARDDMESRANQLGGEVQSRQKTLLGLMKLDRLEPLRARSSSPGFRTAPR